MAEFDDYINSLEGQESIDPLVVASKLHELHTQELGTREAKIAELKDTVAAKDSDISARETALAKQKSMNFDLAMQIPGMTQQIPAADSDEKPTGANITIGDLFSDKVRKRHGI